MRLLRLCLTSASEPWPRRTPVRVLSVGLALLGLSPVHAQETLLRLEAPETLREGDRSAVIAVVNVAPELPFLLTPAHEGRAVEVVRGRLDRTHTEQPDASPLRIRIPIVARTQGTGALRVRLQTYVCAGERCHAHEEERVLTLTVAPSRDASEIEGRAAVADESPSP